MLLAGCFFSGAALAQEPKRPEKQDPEIKQLTKELESKVKDQRMRFDDEAVQLMQQLFAKHRQVLHKKDEALVVKGLGKVFATRARKPEKAAIYRTGAKLLGQIGGKDAVRILKSAYTSKKPFPDHGDYVRIRSYLLDALGDTKDPSVIKFLYNEASKAKHALLNATAGEALGNFAHMPFKRRREIVDKLLIKWGDLDRRVKDFAAGGINSEGALDTLSAIQDKWSSTLNKLTRQKLRTFEEWQRWYQNHKDDAAAWGKDKPESDPPEKAPKKGG